jgi:anti-sigma regulatory factor (Ser/Thr protein kinase)
VTAPRSGARRTLADFTLPSEPGNERRAMDEVASAVSGLGLPERTLERLKTAVAEATMNAMEHGNNYEPGVPPCAHHRPGRRPSTEAERGGA